jgi:VWFA-related protein
MMAFGFWFPSRCLLLAAALSTFGPVELTAGQSNPSRPPGQTAPVFRSGVEVVNVPVTVRDRSGKPVTDLSADDFEIVDNKQHQQVLMCQRIDIPLVRPSEQGVGPLAVPLDVSSNEFPEQPRSFLILLDDIHVSGRRTRGTREILKQFVTRAVGDGDIVAVATTTGQPGVTLDFTQDKARVLRAIDAFTGLQPPGQSFLDPVFDAKSTMGLIARLAAAFSDVTGPRVAMILVSEGVHYDTNNLTSLASSDITKSVQQAVGALRRANVVLYAIDPRGLSTADQDAPDTSLQQQDLADQKARMDPLHAHELSDALRISIQSLAHLSEATGGFALTNSNDYRQELNRVVEEAGAYYLLGYQPSLPPREGVFRPITVRVLRPGLRVSAREGYVRGPVRREPAKMEGAGAGGTAIGPLRRALPVAGLGLRVQAVTLPLDRTRFRVHIIADVSGDSFRLSEQGGRFVEQLDFALLTVGAKGHRDNGKATTAKLRLPPADRSRAADAGVRWVTAVDLKPGRYQLRVAAHAVLTGRTGSIFSDVEVPNLGLQPGISELVLGTDQDAAPVLVGEAGLPLRVPAFTTTSRRFREGSRVFVAAEVYGREGFVLPGTVSLRVRRDGAADSVDMQFPLQAETGGRPRLFAEVPIAGLGVGRFTLSVEFGDPRWNAGRPSRQVAFEIVAQ